MSIANSVSCDMARRAAPLAAVPAHSAGSLTKAAGIHAYPLADTCRAAPMHRDPAAWQVRENEGEYDIPDLLWDDDYAPDPDLDDAADAHTELQREAMALIDDAGNLMAVLLDAIENDGDSRAMQAEAVLKVVRKKLRKAHTRVYRQNARHRNLFMAYFELKARSEKEAE